MQVTDYDCAAARVCSGQSNNARGLEDLLAQLTQLLNRLASLLGDVYASDDVDDKGDDCQDVATSCDAAAATNLPPVADTRLAGGSPLAGKPLRYLIGTDSPGPGDAGTITEVGYDVTQPVASGISIAYVNLFDERNTGAYGPYLHTSDTAAQYNEGQIDPNGPGWEKNLREQFAARQAQGFEYIELDNPDAYSIKDVLRAVDLAATYGLKVIAKNPGLFCESDAIAFVQHPNVVGIIVERDAGTPASLDAIRAAAGKADLPVWFVSFGSGSAWAAEIANAAEQYVNMSVTYSGAGEYGSSADVFPG